MRQLRIRTVLDFWQGLSSSTPPDWADIEKRIAEYFSGQDFTMARIPEATALLATGRPDQLKKVLIAAILSMSEDDDEAMIVVKDADIRKADRFDLIMTDITEENTVVLTVRPK